MLREVVKIDEELCDGCGQCIPNCQEGALQMIDGKARLISDLMCDGLGACLGHCPQGAITIEEREAEAYDETEVTSKVHHSQVEEKQLACGCAGSEARSFAPQSSGGQPAAVVAGSLTLGHPGGANQLSELRQWPVQMHLLNPTASYFRQTDMVLAADCVAFSLGNFHSKWLKGKTLGIACPKLDDGQESYISKIKSLIDDAKINTLTVMMMQVPCCGGLLQIAKIASSQAERKIPVKSVIVGVEGEILQEEWI
jgi:NAD-dependent dihydropyrimidine dehydrogenase PreA subunit